MVAGLAMLAAVAPATPVHALVVEFSLTDAPAHATLVVHVRVRLATTPATLRTEL